MKIFQPDILAHGYGEGLCSKAHTIKYFIILLVYTPWILLCMDW